MNNYRLSTNKGRFAQNERSMEVLSTEERNIILESIACFEHMEDGRLREVNTGKLSVNRSTPQGLIRPPAGSMCVYEVIKPSGEILILDSFTEVLKILGVGFRTLKRHIDENNLVNYNEYNGFKLRRVPVFLTSRPRPYKK